MAIVDISFNGYDLQSGNVMVDTIDHASIPAKNAQVYTLAHGSGSTIPYISYDNKTVTVNGTVIGSSITDLDARLDTFRSYFNAANGNLDIAYGTGTRRYTATVTELQVSRPGNLTYATFSAVFMCTNPYGQDTSQTVALNASSRTAANVSDVIAFTGTAPEQRVVATYSYVGLTGGTSGNVTIGNAATGQSLTVNRNWVAGDVLQIDCVNKLVTVNGIEVDFTGAFPLFSPGSNTITYVDSFTTRTYEVTVSYYALWL